jgi:Leucine-rich repeat (LRR) protein
MADGTYSTATLGQLAAALREQGLTSEALCVMRNLDGAGREAITTWKAALLKAGIDRGPTLDGSEMRLDLSGLQNLIDLAPLRGMPLNKLLLAGAGVSDLTPLAGMPLTTLSMNNTRVTDLTPLSGAPLRDLSIDGQVKSLAPLRGAPLERLVVNHNGRRVVTTDYEVLRDMPLTELRLNSSGFADLRLLAGKKFTTLEIMTCPIADLMPMRELTVENLQMASLSRASIGDLAFLAGQKMLRTLNVSDNRALADLSALRGLAVDDLNGAGTAVTDLRPLAGSTISSLSLSFTPFTAIEQVAALSNLKSLDLRNTLVADLAPLAGSAIQRLQLDGCVRLRSVAPLAKMAALRVVGLPVQVRNVETLREIKSLQWIGYTNNPPTPFEVGKRGGEMREFWQMHDLERQLRAAEPDGRLRPSKFPYMPVRFPGARQLGKSWYYFLKGKTTWPEAKQLAEDLGGHLATITSEAEYQTARQACPLSQGQVCWLGGQTDKPGGSWRWVNGEPWSFTRWAKRKDGKVEPNGFDISGKPETVLAFGFFSAIFVSPPDLCDVAPDHPDNNGMLIEWED